MAAKKHDISASFINRGFIEEALASIPASECVELFDFAEKRGMPEILERHCFSVCATACRLSKFGPFRLSGSLYVDVQISAILSRALLLTALPELSCYGAAIGRLTENRHDLLLSGVIKLADSLNSLQKANSTIPEWEQCLEGSLPDIKPFHAVLGAEFALTVQAHPGSYKRLVGEYGVKNPLITHLLSKKIQPASLAVLF